MGGCGRPGNEFVKLQMVIGEEEKEGGTRAQAEWGWPLFSRDPAATVEAGCSITKTKERGILLAQVVMVWMLLPITARPRGGRTGRATSGHPRRSASTTSTPTHPAGGHAQLRTRHQPSHRAALAARAS